jgi:hypothetical protein
MGLARREFQVSPSVGTEDLQEQIAQPLRRCDVAKPFAGLVVELADA